MVVGFLLSYSKQQKLKSTFSQYIPAQHVAELLNQSEKRDWLVGETKEITVIFVDIRNFTSIAENLTATEIKKFLNEFLTPITKVIFDHGGTIDKYIGDCVMAFWGAPLVDSQHAQHALAACLQMVTLQSKLQYLAQEFHFSQLGISIGVNSGMASVGDMGSSYRLSYTVLGDSVNLASRLEGLTKLYGVNLLVSEYTKNLAPHLIYRIIDKVRVKGKNISITIYEPLGTANELSEIQLSKCTLHNEAMNYYFDKNFSKAKDIFEKMGKQYIDDHFYPLFNDRINNIIAMGQYEQWDGIYQYNTK
jgi:adenylate cyclase